MSAILKSIEPELEEVESGTIDSTHVLSLTDFIDEFGGDLIEAVKRQNPPIYDGIPNVERTRIMEAMPRKPFMAQQRVVQAVSQLLIDEGSHAAIINAEMGTGKTMMSIAVSAVMHEAGYKRTLVLSPPHLVYKWRREILESVDNAKVWILNGPDTLAKLLALRLSLGAVEHDGPEYFILGRVRMRLGFNWKTALLARKKHIRCTENVDDSSSRHFWKSVAYAACTQCGLFQCDEDGDLIRIEAYPTDQRKCCQSCGNQLWSLVRNRQVKNREQMVIDSLCQIPTVGPKTAKMLVTIFGDEAVEQMLGDNVYDFINLMDQNGNMVFSDRRALRIEKAMAKMEFGFGQGGYQPSEFIKRYLPTGFFSLMICDEGHEYKNESAQGQAMGVIANKVDKVLLLTGTLMGGYATDLYYLLWRILGDKMRDDGYHYNDRGTLGTSAMKFMEDYGVLKSVFKETEAESHRTARGSKNVVRVSKAPGFSPKGIARYVLPYTIFLKLKDIGEGVLPDYSESLIEVDMTQSMLSCYQSMQSSLSQELKQALARGDTTLMGVVLSALLRWPETCYQTEEICHPRTGNVLHFNDPMIMDDELTPKEEAMVDLCRRENEQGRRVIIYTIYTGKYDCGSRLKSVLTNAGLKAAVLRSTVSPEKREDWIMEQVDRGIDNLICNPELVKTGLDLYDFPTLLFMQSGTNVYTVQQASRRSWRIGQTQAVKVYYAGYRASQQALCLKLMAEKIAVSQSTSGEMPESGLDSLNSDSESVEVELARMLAA